MSDTLRAALQKWVPPWLSARPLLDRGFKYLYSFALVIDAAVQAAIWAVEARLPGIGTFTALFYLGRDRRIRRGRAESNEAYVERLKRWREDWRRAGNPYTLMRQLQGYLYPKSPRMRIVNTQGTWYTLNTDGTIERHGLEGNWDWDGDSDLWARFWVIIYSDSVEAPWTRDGTWGDGELWGEPTTDTWGSTATLEQLADMRDILDLFKSATGVCKNIIICFDDDAFDPTDTAPPLPDGTWGNWSTGGSGARVRSRDSSAIYCDGVA